MSKIPTPFDPYIVAEISSSHAQDWGTMDRLIRQAKLAGADAIKLQMYNPDEMVLDRDYVVMAGPWKGQTLYDLYVHGRTPKRFVPMVMQLCASLDIDWFASVFSLNDLRFCELAKCQRYKIASFEAIDYELIAAAAATGKPLVISSGMCSWDEIVDAVKIAKGHGCTDLTVLLCTSAYPATVSSYDISRLATWGFHLNCKIGISDHTEGIAVAIAATALGASMIEKHIQLSEGPDHNDADFAPNEFTFKAMCQGVHEAAAAVRGLSEEDLSIEDPSRLLRRSLWVTKDIKAGEPFTIDNVGTARPALGLHPSHLAHVLRGVADRDYSAGTPLTLLT